MYNQKDSNTVVSDYSMKTTPSLTSVIKCSMCCKPFQSSFFMNINECGHRVCKVCINDWNHEIENQFSPVCRSCISERQLNINSYIQTVDDHLDEIHYEKTNKSSGGILVHRVKGTLYYLAVQQRCNGDLQWVSPKGRIERGESSLEAAQREISEEVGLKSITLIDFVSSQSYTFKESDKLCKKTVFWYLFDVHQPSELVLNEEEGFVMSKWITYEETMCTFSHASFIEIIKVADSIFHKN